MIQPLGIRRIQDADDFSGPLTDGYFLKYVATASGFQLAVGGSGSGSVTSVALTMPAEFSVAGSPITSTGTLAVTKANQGANLVYAGPSAGVAAAPGFRSLVAADIPALSYVTSVGLSLPGIFTVSGSPVTSAGTLTATLANQSANLVFAGPSLGAAAAPTFRALVAGDIPALNYVTSVGLSGPSIFTVSGSPVTSSGTLTFSLNAQNANLVFAGPSSGAAAAPTFRSLVAGDIPALAYVTNVALAAPSIFTVSGSPVTSSGTLTLTLATQTANKVFAGPSSGGAVTPTFRALVPADYPVFVASGTSHAVGAVPDPGSTAGTTHFLREDASWQTAVTSVALTMPAEFAVAGSPITTSGTLAVTKATQSANLVWASPNGASGAPAFRALVAADIPALAYVTSVGLSLPNIFSVSGSPVTSSGTLAGTLVNQSANTMFAGPASGAAATPAFRLLQAADYPIPSGTTLPATPAKQFFLHTPTGRKILYFYDGAAWISIQSDGPMTVYVDTALGTDDLSHGTGTGANAFQTIQFAINAIPGLVGGNVIVNIAAGIYREQVTIDGKQFTGDYTITLQGAKGADTVGSTTATSGANPAGNGSAGFGTITKTGATYTVNALIGKLLEITSGTGAGQIYVVHANTATVITVEGQWGTVPDSTSVYHVFDAGTRLTGSNAGADTTPVRSNCLTVQNGQSGILASLLRLDYAASTGVDCQYGANLTLTNCQIVYNNWNAVVQYYAFLTLQYCWLGHAQAGGAYANPSGYDVYFGDGGIVYLLWYCRLDSAGANVVNLWGTAGGEISYLGDNYIGIGTSGTGPDKCLYLELHARVAVGDYNEFDHGTVQNIHITTDAIVGTSQALTLADNVTKNSGGWGVLSETGGQGQKVSQFTFSGNTSGTYSPTTALAGGNS